MCKNIKVFLAVFYALIALAVADRDPEVVIDKREERSEVVVQHQFFFSTSKNLMDKTKTGQGKAKVIG